MIGVYNHVWIAPYNMEHIMEFQVEKKLGSHDKAYIKGIISETSLAMYQNMIDGKTIVSVLFEQEKETQLLFAGYVSGIQVTEVGEHAEAIMLLEGLTQALDRAESILEYQDVSKTNHGLIDGIMKSYPDIPYDIFCKKKTIENLLLQYEETDYEFMTRLLSQAEELIYTVMQGRSGRICFGLKALDSQKVFEETEYEIFYKEGIQYRLVHEEYVDIGMQVMLDGTPLIVREAEYCYQNGESENRYCLSPASACKGTLIRNEKMTGVSLDGTITDCKRDKVKIELNQTLPCEEEKRKWFAYSSPAASSDGSGWYCMPKKGEEIRLYCPTNDESEAYVISAIRKEQGAQQTHQPVDKVWANPEGQEVDFTQDGVKLTSNGGAVSMDLKSDGTIDIVADNNLEIYAGKAVMLHAEYGMSITSAKEIILSNDNGSELEIGSDITENANRIKNNC